MVGIDRARLLEHLRFFSTETPNRAAGSADEARAADYAAENLRAAGWRVAFEPFETLTSRVRETVVSVSGDRDLPAVGIGYATPRGSGRFLDLVDAGDGSLAAYNGVDAAGKAVLVAAGGPSVPDKSFIAHRKGAAAVLLASPPSPEPSLALRAQKGVWGPPLPEDLLDLPDVTAVSLTHQGGQRLRELLRLRGRVQVRLGHAAETLWRPLRQLVARFGPDEAEFVLLHGHLDAWSPGVTDNATGIAALLETGRALAQGPVPPRGLRLALWTGHEVEEASGSAAFVEAHWAELRRCVAHLNVDSPGCEGGERVILYRSLELRTLASSVLAAEGVPLARELPLAKESDNSFALAGVPGLGVVPAGESVGTSPGQRVAPLWWMHTDRDTIERVRPDLLVRDTALALKLARVLARRPTLHDFAPVQDLLHDTLAQLGDPSLLAAWPKAAKALAGVRSGEGARHVSRLLLATLGTRGGRLHQDRYGDPHYAYEYPGIAHLLGADAPEHTLLPARLRERNRLDDLIHALQSLEASPDGP